MKYIDGFGDDEYRICNGCGKRVTRDDGFVGKLVVEDDGKVARGDVCRECAESRYNLSFDRKLGEYKFSPKKAREK